MSNELKLRLVFGPLFALIFVGTIIVDVAFATPFAVLILLSIGVVAASLEYAKLLRPRVPGIQRASLAGMSLLLIWAPWITSITWGPLAPDLPSQGLLLGLGFVWIALRQFQRYGTDHFIANVGGTTLGLCYIGLLPSMLANLILISPEAQPSQGHILLLLVVATVKMGDIGAFVGGKNFGKHKMAPSISPGKTWEGFIASFIGALAGSYIFIGLVIYCGGSNPFPGWWQAGVWAIILGPIGVLGDLWESGVKRDLAVKDSGQTIPGFGGILDVFDAIILAAPVAYLLAIILT